MLPCALRLRAIGLSLVLGACGRTEPAPTGTPAPTSSSAALTPSAPPSAEVRFAVTPNEFLAKGSPSFVVGTLGDDVADRIVVGQARMIRGLFFPTASLVEDTAVASGPWPSRPIVYGGPHVNSALAAITARLPFTLGVGKLSVGGEVFEGDDVLLITVVPARAADTGTAGHPELLIFAGTGTPGVAEINALGSGNSSILVADRFGPLTTGHWVRREGAWVGKLVPRAKRPAFRTVERAFRGKKLFFSVLSSEPATLDLEPFIGACMRGLDRVIDKLAVDAPEAVHIYLYPDGPTKGTLTGQPGNGHAVPSSSTLHMVRFDPAKGGALERLVAHEGTHVLATAAWGGPGTPAMGEGLAVWVAGGYGASTLAEWKKVSVRPKLEALLGKGFFRLKEPESYPASALLVDAAVTKIGLAKFREHLYVATGGTWREACKAAGAPALAED